MSKKKTYPSQTKEAKAAYYRKNKDRYKQRARRNHLLRTYGLTEEAYESMLKGQGGVCALCGEKCQTHENLSVDHCHETGKVRGLLCRSCNYQLAFVEKVGTARIHQYLEGND